MGGKFLMKKETSSLTPTPKMWCEKDHYDQPREKWIEIGIHIQCKKSYLSIDILRSQRESWCYMDKCYCACSNVYIASASLQHVHVYGWMCSLVRLCVPVCVYYTSYKYCVVNRSQAILPAKANTHYTYTILPPDRAVVCSLLCLP